ncbi:RHS repeat-associated core domain protein [Delftia acidovorans]|nr:RHS repeat-associated core domain-containing protein [Delftia acidovorans]KFJ08659.1 RHS repeat-associated core domain protein [Delftia acidovorans]MCG8986717.1 RHS domain-containing protein [Delftia acidovorans]
MALTDQTGQVAWAVKLDPWGNVLQEYNPQGLHQAIRLPGQHHDRETGLYYNRHRYYDPVVGIYVNQDPIGLMGGVNFFTYPSNPLTRSHDSIPSTPKSMPLPVGEKCNKSRLKSDPTGPGTAPTADTDDILEMMQKIRTRTRGTRR